MQSEFDLFGYQKLKEIKKKKKTVNDPENAVSKVTDVVSPFPFSQQAVDDPFQHWLLDVLRLNAHKTLNFQNRNDQEVESTLLNVETLSPNVTEPNWTREVT